MTPRMTERKRQPSASTLSLERPWRSAYGIGDSTMTAPMQAARAVMAGVGRVAQQLDVLEPGGQLESAVARAVVDEDDLHGGQPRLARDGLARRQAAGDDALDGGFLVVGRDDDRQGRHQSFRAARRSA